MRNEAKENTEAEQIVCVISKTKRKTFIRLYSLECRSTIDVSARMSKYGLSHPQGLQYVF